MKKNLSVRTSYLIISTLVSIIVVVLTISANNYISGINNKNAEKLQLSKLTIEKNQKLKNNLSIVFNQLNTMLSTTNTDNSDFIKQKLDSSEKLIYKLTDNRNISDHSYVEAVSEIDKHFFIIREKIEYLLSKREDINWVYPAFPYITQKLLEPNFTFETQTRLALDAIEAQDGKPYGSQFYIKFVEARELWRLKILNFRAVIVRITGLNNTSQLSQETRLQELHQQIEKKLADIAMLSETEELDFEAEVALDALKQASTDWISNWNEFQQIRTGKNWRGDVSYLNTEIQTTRSDLLNSINHFENLINTWSSENLIEVSEASNTINHALWLLSGLGLCFIVLIYVMLDRSVLRPLSLFSNQISSDNNLSIFNADRLSRKEINQLAESFNSLRKQIRERQVALEYQALHDTLTGLPNRMSLNDRLDQALKIMKRAESSMAMMILDLDRFKEINDSMGHQAGDMLLQEVGARLHALIRQSDTIARLGGDEFALILPNTNTEKAVAFANKIGKAIDQEFLINKKPLYVGASIGISIYPDHGEDAATLTRLSDIAMYNAKRNKQIYAIYEQSMVETGVNKLSLVGDLKNELISSKNLQLYYQPKVDLFSKQVRGVEVLLRWNHPDEGFISPEQIIKLAEHSGSIEKLTNWIIETALKEFSGLNTGEKITLSINLSAWNLQDRKLPKTISMLLIETGFNPSNLIFEVTESAMMNDPVVAREIMNSINEMGIRFSIDDFGTGFSSLSYLKLLPVDEIKIDKSFVLEMLESNNDKVIVKSTIDLAHNLGLNVVAEGIENNQTFLQLLTLRCDLAQGYHISKPLPLTVFIDWYKKYNLKLA
ncbi:MAG: EAL domain-containing protein [Gammaproteobacteria bacterium]|nr:EAL domain-containing protein [Gammaproteobacteria bacterium]